MQLKAHSAENNGLPLLLAPYVEAELSQTFFLKIGEKKHMQCKSASGM
jgi:hypothetical protein|tara:strand:- start:89 stop:232 length:144 start_codon:yes stop_codon:yes gene_type:complete